jgi:hypothetical protein
MWVLTNLLFITLHYPFQKQIQFLCNTFILFYFTLFLRVIGSLGMMRQ